MSRLDSRDYSWFVLCVPPQREFVVEILLSRTGFAIFIPTKREFKFANMAARRRGRKTEMTLPIMPRYVFMGMNDHTPGWYGALRFKVITGIIGFDGQPYEMPNEPLRKLMWQHNSGEFNAPLHHRYMQTHREFEEGDDVITDDGLFEGKVVQISGNMAKVFIEMFGQYREVSITLEKLVAA